MSNRINRLLGRNETNSEKEVIGEDMVPSPDTLAERSALSGASEPAAKRPSGPYRTVARQPLPDFTS